MTEANNEEVKETLESVKAEEILVESEAEECVDDSAPEQEEKKQEEDYKSKFYYLAAEMDNMKKRFSREKESLVKYGNERVLSALLDVVDNLERTIQAIQNDQDDKVKNIFIGIEMVKNQFLEVLKQNGLEPVDAIGKIFDPNFHEAMAQQPAKDKQNDEIISEYQRGYILNGRLIRPSKVIVAKKSEE